MCLLSLITGCSYITSDGRGMGVWQMVTIADEGGGEVSQMLTIADKGGGDLKKFQQRVFMDTKNVD